MTHLQIARVFSWTRPRGSPQDPLTEARLTQWRLCCHAMALSLIEHEPHLFNSPSFYDAAGWPERYQLPTTSQLPTTTEEDTSHVC